MLEEIITKAFSVDANNQGQMLAADVFAMGCHLHANGQKDSGKRLCARSLSCTRLSEGMQRKIKKQLAGNEREFAYAACPKSKVNELFGMKSPAEAD